METEQIFSKVRGPKASKSGDWIHVPSHRSKAPYGTFIPWLLRHHRQNYCATVARKIRNAIQCEG